MKHREDFYNRKIGELIDDLQYAHSTGKGDEMVARAVKRYSGDVQYLLLQEKGEVKDDGIRRQGE